MVFFFSGIIMGFKISELKETLEKHNMDLIGPLNNGAFGTIFRAKINNSNSQVAVKLYKNKFHTNQYFANEVSFVWVTILFSSMNSSMKKIFDKSRQCVCTHNEVEIVHYNCTWMIIEIFFK